MRVKLEFLSATYIAFFAMPFKLLASKINLMSSLYIVFKFNLNVVVLSVSESFLIISALFLTSFTLK